MNLQYCRSVWTAKMELRSLQEELEGCVGRRSPTTMGVRYNAGTHGDITASSVIRRESLRRRIDGMIERSETIIDRAEDELELIQDAEFRALLRWRHFFHRSWRDISSEYTNRLSPDAIKKRYQRFCSEYNIEEHDDEVRSGTLLKEGYAYGAS